MSVTTKYLQLEKVHKCIEVIFCQENGGKTHKHMKY